MQYSDTAVDHAIKNPIGISGEWDDADSWALIEPWRAFRLLGDTFDDFADTRFERLSGSVSKHPSAIGRELAQIVDSASRVFDGHTRRNAWNASSTSASVAMPLCSASSTACSSSGVATYTPVRRASMSRAASSSSKMSSSGQEANRSSSFCVFGVMTAILSQSHYRLTSPAPETIRSA